MIVLMILSFFEVPNYLHTSTLTQLLAKSMTLLVLVEYYTSLQLQGLLG